MWIQRSVHSGASGSITDSQYTSSKKKIKATQIRIPGLDAMKKRKSGFKGREIKSKGMIRRLRKEKSSILSDLPSLYHRKSPLRIRRFVTVDWFFIIRIHTGDGLNRNFPGILARQWRVRRRMNEWEKIVQGTGGWFD